MQAVAAALDVHPQTVRYRLKQLRELFGDALEDPEARFELSLALRAAEGCAIDRAMRLLVTGAAGMLGTDVVAAAAGHESSPSRAPTSTSPTPTRCAPPCATPARTRSSTARRGPTSTAPRPTRRTPRGSTATAPGHLAAAAAEAGAHIVHVSTDYVFDGDATSPYREDAPTGPIGAYGRSKLAGELAVAAARPASHAIVRTAWVFGPHGKNFVDTMLRLGAERDEVTVVDDQLGCPTYTGHLAAALVQIAEQRTHGVLHVAGGGPCTWWDLAVATFERAGLHPPSNSSMRPERRPGR